MNLIKVFVFFAIPYSCQSFTVQTISQTRSVVRPRTPLQLSARDDDVQTNPAAFERAWKHVKKPLLRIGAQGVSRSHGNSLRELLQAHTLVKVKVNSVSLGSLEQVFYTLKDEAENMGAAKDIELIMSRESANTILIGMPGSLERIRKGEFPPVM